MSDHSPEVLLPMTTELGKRRPSLLWMRYSDSRSDIPGEGRTDKVEDQNGQQTSRMPIGSQ